MGEINKGHTYANGDLVTFENLNQLVDLATLNNGAITLQDPVGSVSQSDLLLISSGGDLKKATVAELSTGLELNQFLKANGSVAMDAGSQLTLGSTTQVSAFQAVSLSHLTNALSSYLLNSGFQIFTGALGIQGGGMLFATGNSLFLGKDPVTDLEAATKQYVDRASNIKAKASFSGVVGDSVTITCTYNRPAGSGTVTVTSSGVHGLKTGHKVFLNTTSGAVTDGRYEVTVVDNYIFTVSTGTVITATSGNCNFVKCLIYSDPVAIGVDSITFAAATNDGTYFVNFTNNFTNLNYAPVFSLSGYNAATNALVSGGIALLDRIAASPISRSVNCLPFSTWAGTYGPCGSRSTVVVF